MVLVLFGLGGLPGPSFSELTMATIRTLDAESSLAGSPLRGSCREIAQHWIGQKNQASLSERPTQGRALHSRNK